MLHGALQPGARLPAAAQARPRQFSLVLCRFGRDGHRLFTGVVGAEIKELLKNTCSVNTICALSLTRLNPYFFDKA
jgi:hypothetical protein